MKIVENPRTKVTERAETFLNLDVVGSLADGAAVPDTKARYPGTSGRTHGERNEITPATMAAKIETSVM